MYYFLLGLNVLVWLVLMFGSVFAIGFSWKVLSAALDLLMRRKSPQVRNFSQADEHRPGQLPT